MIKRILSHRLTGAFAFLLIFGGLVLVTLRDGEAVEKTRKGWLGVSVQELTPSLREAMKVGNRSGLLITQVVEGSPAEDANLKEEDVILEFDGKAVEKADEFVRLVRNTPPDKNVKVKFIRDGEERQVEVTIGKRRSERFSHVYGFGDGKNLMILGRPRLGVQVHELNKDLAAYFKVEENSGVLVLDVQKDTPAEKAGLKAGDVITRIDNESVSDPDDLVATLDDYEEGDAITIEYVRQGQTANVEVELEYADGRGFHFQGPGRHDIRIRNFGRESWRDAELIIPELKLRKQIEAMQQKLHENLGRDRLKLKKLPTNLDFGPNPVI